MVFEFIVLKLNQNNEFNLSTTFVKWKTETFDAAKAWHTLTVRKDLNQSLNKKMAKSDYNALSTCPEISITMHLHKILQMNKMIRVFSMIKDFCNEMKDWSRDERQRIRKKRWIDE